MSTEIEITADLIYEGGRYVNELAGRGRCGKERAKYHYVTRITPYTVVSLMKWDYNKEALCQILCF